VCCCISAAKYWPICACPVPTLFLWISRERLLPAEHAYRRPAADALVLVAASISALASRRRGYLFLIGQSVVPIGRSVINSRKEITVASTLRPPIDKERHLKQERYDDDYDCSRDSHGEVNREDKLPAE
jgi:hypothetical protein